MKPKEAEKEANQGDLFRSRLDQILNRRHPIFILANETDWGVFDEEFGASYVDNVGRPGCPTRVMVGLCYLKHTYNESDESVVEKFIENPYWQYFCGYTHFQHTFPIDPSSQTRFRHRIGPKGMKKLLQETLETAKRRGQITKQDIKRVNVDTTVQEKAIAYPTDARLYQKARRILVCEARKREIELRQSYERLGKRVFFKQSQYARAKQMKRARKETKKLKIYLGRVIRDIRRKWVNPDETFVKLVNHCQRIFEQKITDSNKVYSVHAPEVECIAKGKAHRRYEFGCKVGLVSTSKNNWILDIEALHGNPYDGHTLKDSLERASAISGHKIKQVFCDRGFRGSQKSVPNVEVILSGRRNLSRTLKKFMRRRSAIEPIIGHLKSDNGMNRNYLKGKDGDRINAILAGCGFNLRKLLGALLRFFFLHIFFNIPQKHYPLGILNFKLA
ncbi:MAG: IS5 family transposase [Candidatus Uhrbacteria bacterium]